MIDNYIQIMIDSLNKKAGILEKISGINEEQGKLIATDNMDMEAFDATVVAKGELIQELSGLDEGFNSLYNRVKVELEDNKQTYASQIKAMQALITRITELSAGIEAYEKRNAKAIENKFSKIKQAVAQTRKNSNAVSNYYRNMSKLDYSPQFMDKKK